MMHNSEDARSCGAAPRLELSNYPPSAFTPLVNKLQKVNYFILFAVYILHTVVVLVTTLLQHVLATTPVPSTILTTIYTVVIIIK